ncbi:MAG: hypothetical protein WDA04_07070 [Anaerolineaceae bacterium]
MKEIIKINCPSCGSMAPHDQRDRDFVCEFCGTHFRIKQTGNDLQIVPFIESIQELKTGMDRTGSEMTIKRLKEEIAELNGQLRLISPEYEKLKREAENPGLALKYRKYWWIGLVLALVLFIIAVASDLMGLGAFAVLLFIGSILMYGLAAQKAIKIKLISRRYEELSGHVIPIREAIDQKSKLIQKRRSLIDQ